MARRVTQTVVEVLGHGGHYRVFTVHGTALCEIDSPLRVSGILMEIMRTPAASSIFLPVTIIVNG